MPPPTYPEEGAKAAWKKAAGAAYAKLEEDLSIGGMLSLLERKDIDADERKAFTELEAAIKSRQGRQHHRAVQEGR